ncbi:hypothetical protein [Arenibacter antarcticus]
MHRVFCKQLFFIIEIGNAFFKENQFITGANDNEFSAFEKATGKLVWETVLPAMANATPNTYWANGKQYVTASVEGKPGNLSGSIMAFTLPN